MIRLTRMMNKAYDDSLNTRVLTLNERILLNILNNYIEIRQIITSKAQKKHRLGRRLLRFVVLIE